MEKLVFLLAALILSVAAPAQKIGGARSNQSLSQLKRVAVLPLMFRESDKGDEHEAGNEEAIGAYRSSLLGVFEKLGMEVIDSGKVNAAWQRLNGQLFNPARFELPSPETLLGLGKELGVDFVVVSRCHWRVRSVWIFFGPRTKVAATVDLWIVDVARSEFSLQADTVKSDSTEREPAWKTTVTVFIAPISLFGGGPKTAHLKRSGVLSLTKAIEPWIEKHSPGKIKIEAKG